MFSQNFAKKELFLKQQKQKAMYINYKLLYKNDLDEDDFHNLQKIFQKDNIYNKDSLQKFEKKGLIQYLKSGEVRISKKGYAFLNDLQIKDYDEDIAEIVENAISSYERNEQPVGNKAEVKARATWFVAQTGFSKRIIIEEINNYLMNNSYILRLDNLFWKPQSHLSVHKNLKDSKLFDIIANKYKLNEEYYFSQNNSEMDWLFKVSNLKVPRNSVYFIGYKEDKLRIEDIKLYLQKILKK